MVSQNRSDDRLVHNATSVSVVLALLLVFFACSSVGPSLADSAASYKNKRDYVSLSRIHDHLVKGMPRAEVERLLGEPDYSPTEGQYYYSSDKKAASDGTDRPPATIGLVVDYRDANGAVTGTLQRFALEAIGE